MASVRVGNIRLNRYLSILASKSGSIFMLIDVFPFAAMKIGYIVYLELTVPHIQYILTIRYTHLARRLGSLLRIDNNQNQ